MDDHGFDPAGGSSIDSGIHSGIHSGIDDQMREDRLIAELRRVVGTVDPVPHGVLTSARAAIATQDLDGDLAELVADSGTRVPAGPVRGGTPRRLLSFSGGEVQVDLEITLGSDRLIGIIGQLSGGSTDDCVLEYPAGRQPVSLDRLGRFAVTGARCGPVRVRCRSAAGVRVTTSWVTL
jgi:hypothetical protein